MISISKRVPARPSPSSDVCSSHDSPGAGHLASDVGDLRNGVGATGDGLVAALALPDTNGLALDGVLAAEGADVAGVLGDFHLLHLLTQGGTVSVGILSIFGSYLCGRFSSEDHGRLSAVSRTGRRAYLVPYLPVIPTSVGDR